jgi:hypothetical protein
VGIDGWSPTKTPTDTNVEQAGVTAFCKTKKSIATYQAFYEMYPLSPVSEPQAVVHAGDAVSVVIQRTGQTYNFTFTDNTDATNFLATANCPKKTKCQDAMAEVITEANDGGPDAGVGLADMGTVEYNNAEVGLGGIGGVNLGALALTKVTLSPTGLKGIVYPGVIPGGESPSNFNTYWK